MGVQRENAFKPLRIIKMELKSDSINKEFENSPIKTRHSFHLVDASPWPVISSLGAFMLTSGGVLFMHSFKGGSWLFALGLLTIVMMMFAWWRDIIREATFEGVHTSVVQKGMRLGMVLFIISEVMFFFAFFWAFFNSSISPTYDIGSVWPPKAVSAISTYTVPLANTFILLTSGLSVTWAHHSLLTKSKKHVIFSLMLTIIMAFIFLSLQRIEYISAPFGISDGAFSSCFFVTTGFHGFHVLIGTIALIVSFVRVFFNHFTDSHHFGFESAIWYWHFVDVVWLFLFISVYWWSN